MIKQLILKDEKISEYDKDLFLKGSGKILKIDVKLKQGVRLKLVTQENEDVLNVTQSGVYYPRCNISSRKYVGDGITGEVREHDYFYFMGGLLVEISSEFALNGEVAVEKLVVTFDNMK